MVLFLSKDVRKLLLPILFLRAKVIYFVTEKGGILPSVLVIFSVSL